MASRAESGSRRTGALTAGMVRYRSYPAMYLFARKVVTVSTATAVACLGLSAGGVPASAWSRPSPEADSAAARPGEQVREDARVACVDIDDLGAA
jgi:hypothetical protein